MAVNLPLSDMTTAEKLSAIELIWDDLSRNQSEVSSPAWHGELLRHREQLVAEGKASFSDWEEARMRIIARCHADSNPRQG